MRILVVEHHHESRVVIRSLLESLGHDVDEATHRTAGLEMLKLDAEIKLVLLNLNLPGDTEKAREGLLFLEQALTLDGTLKILLMNHSPDTISDDRAIELGAFDVIAKPFDQSLLAQSIERAMLFHKSHEKLRTNQKVPMYIVADASAEQSMKNLRETVIQCLLKTVLGETRHNVSETARRLNITREHLYYYLKKHGIERPAD